MNRLQVINEVLRKADEPQVTSTENHDGVRKLKLFLVEVGRELVYNYEIPESIRYLALNVVTQTAEMTAFGASSRITFNGSLLGVVKGQIVDEITYANGRNLGTKTTSSSVMSLIAQNPLRQANVAASEEVKWATAPYFGDTTSTTRDLICYPQLPVNTPIRVRMRVNHLDNDAITDTSGVVFPPHLLVLGTYAKWMMDSKGADNVDAQKAQAVYESAVGSHVAVSSEDMGAPKDWIPE
jgi:hypothetical protein